MSNGLPIGGWDTVYDPERMKMELVESLHACIEANRMSIYTVDGHGSSTERTHAKKGKKGRVSLSQNSRETTEKPPTNG